MNAPLLLPLATLAAATATTIYEGRVYPPGHERAAYTYERRVAADADGGLVASHLTRDAAGTALIEETAHLTADYALRRFEADNRQQGFRGSATLSADATTLRFDVVERDGRRVRTSRRVHGPVVAGPSLHGFILRHSDRLHAGEAIDVQMIVLARATTYGFRIRLHSRDAHRTAFTVAPTNWLVRWAVAPLHVAFDPVTRHVVMYRGRVPPQWAPDGRLRELDARVDYTMKAAAYR